MADPQPSPKVTIVRDEQDRQLAYVSMDELTYSQAIENVGPSYQKMVLRDREEASVFINYSLNSFIFAPSLMREILLGSCEHLYDIPDSKPINNSVSSSPLPNQSGSSSEAATGNQDQVLNTGSPSQPAILEQQHIRRPRNSWIIYRSEKSKQLHQNNPNMPAGTVSTEVARMWKDESPELRDFYQHLATMEGQAHKEKYPNWSYKPAKN